MTAMRKLPAVYSSHWQSGLRPSPPPHIPHVPAACIPQLREDGYTHALACRRQNTLLKSRWFGLSATRSEQTSTTNVRGYVDIRTIGSKIESECEKVANGCHTECARYAEHSAVNTYESVNDNSAVV